MDPREPTPEELSELDEQTDREQELLGICSRCNGSSEGLADGSSCWYCGGTGEVDR